MSNLIYKICSHSEWQTALKNRTYEGSNDDMRDGFIHFSTSAQLAGTLKKHFSGKKNLVLVTVDADTLGPLLKWEKSRGGALFPHLFDKLDVETAINVQEITLTADGHILPDLDGI